MTITRRAVLGATPAAPFIGDRALAQRVPSRPVTVIRALRRRRADRHDRAPGGGRHGAASSASPWWRRT